jgi:polysaccharide deacetylase family protein (PEP-CTERM system associated)
MINAFTVDVEDYYQVSGFETTIGRNAWDSFESRVVANTQRLLDLMDRHDVHGTFFVLGWVAEHHARLVEEIHQRGHEIGSHSYWHRLVYKHTPAEFREDLRRSRDALEDIVGKPIIAYRAPSFSITDQSLWALEILVEEGFQIDSSVFPIHHDRYGIPDARRGPHRLQTPSGAIWEFPPTVARLAGLNFPVGGGGYFRLFPVAWTNHWLRHVQEHEHDPVMFYVHPWEVDANQPRLQAGGTMARFRHYVNLAKTERKLGQLMGKFSFGSLSDALKEYFGGLEPSQALKLDHPLELSHAV